MYNSGTRFLSTENDKYVLNTHILSLGCPLVPADSTYKRKKFGSFLILNYVDLFYMFFSISPTSDYILIQSSRTSLFLAEHCLKPLWTGLSLLGHHPAIPLCYVSKNRL